MTEKGCFGLWMIIFTGLWLRIRIQKSTSFWGELHAGGQADSWLMTSQLMLRKPGPEVVVPKWRPHPSLWECWDSCMIGEEGRWWVMWPPPMGDVLQTPEVWQQDEHTIAGPSNSRTNRRCSCDTVVTFLEWGHSSQKTKTSGPPSDLSRLLSSTTIAKVGVSTTISLMVNFLHQESKF